MNHCCLSKCCMSCNIPFKVRPSCLLCLANSFICSSATPHQFQQRTSTVRASAFWRTHKCHCSLRTPSAKEAIISRAFLASRRLSVKRSGSLWIHVLLCSLLMITALSANSFLELIQAVRVLPCPASHTNREKFQHGLGLTPLGPVFGFTVTGSMFCTSVSKWTKTSFVQI